MGNRSISTSIFGDGASTELFATQLSGADSLDNLDKAQKAQFELVAALADANGDGKVDEDEAAAISGEDKQITQEDIDAIMEELGVTTEEGLDKLLEDVDAMLESGEYVDPEAVTRESAIAASKQQTEETGLKPPMTDGTGVKANDDGSYSVTVEEYRSGKVQDDGLGGKRYPNGTMWGTVENAYYVKDKETVYGYIREMNPDLGVLNPGEEIRMPILKYDDKGNINGYYQSQVVVTNDDGTKTQTSVTPDGSKEIVEFDKSGNPVSAHLESESTDAEGNVTKTVTQLDKTSLESTGESLTTVTNKDGKTVSEQSTKNGETTTTNYVYNADGTKTTQVINPDGSKVITDADGNVVKMSVIEAQDSAAASYAYESNGMKGTLSVYPNDDGTNSFVFKDAETGKTHLFVAVDDNGNIKTENTKSVTKDAEGNNVSTVTYADGHTEVYAAGKEETDSYTQETVVDDQGNVSVITTMKDGSIIYGDENGITAEIAAPVQQSSSSRHSATTSQYTGFGFEDATLSILNDSNGTSYKINGKDCTFDKTTGEVKLKESEEVEEETATEEVATEETTVDGEVVTRRDLASLGLAQGQNDSFANFAKAKGYDIEKVSIEQLQQYVDEYQGLVDQKNEFQDMYEFFEQNPLLKGLLDDEMALTDSDKSQGTVNQSLEDLAGWVDKVGAFRTSGETGTNAYDKDFAERVPSAISQMKEIINSGNFSDAVVQQFNAIIAKYENAGSVKVTENPASVASEYENIGADASNGDSFGAYLSSHNVDIATATREELDAQLAQYESLVEQKDQFVQLYQYFESNPILKEFLNQKFQFADSDSSNGKVDQSM